MTTTSMDERGAAARRVMAEAVPTLEAGLAGRTWSLYALGSLGYGNYVPGWSDIDLDVIITSPVEESRLDLVRLGESLTSRVHDSGHLDVDVKCFHLDELGAAPTSTLYGVANRQIMLLDSAVHLHGTDIRHIVPRPTHKALREEAERIATDLSGMDGTWWETRPLDDLAALLALPARLLHTARTGEVVDKRTALENLLQQHSTDLPAECWAWSSWALACRFSPAARRLPECHGAQAREAARSALRWVAAHPEVTR
jgi:hypothetical protein